MLLVALVSHGVCPQLRLQRHHRHLPGRRGRIALYLFLRSTDSFSGTVSPDSIKALLLADSPARRR